LRHQIGILLLPGRALRQRKRGTEVPGRAIGILLLPGRALRQHGADWRHQLPIPSEYSSCPEGHYDKLSPHIVRLAYIGILLLPGRALRQTFPANSTFGLYRNTPPARKGITTNG